MVVVFALACGALAAAWQRGRLGVVAFVLLVIAFGTWIGAFAAITTEFGDANGFATCDPDCTAVHYVAAVAFFAPPLLIVIGAFAILVEGGSRWRMRRARAQENHG